MLASCRPASYIPPLRSTACKPRICYVIRSADAGARTWPTGDSPESPEHASQAPQDSKPKPFLQKLKTWIFGGPLDKERIKSLGLGAFLAYGCASWPRCTRSAVYAIGSPPSRATGKGLGHAVASSYSLHVSDA